MAREKAWSELTDTGKLRRLSGSKYYQEYKKQRDRIKKQTERMLARGYSLPADILPPIPKKLTQGSINRLKKITTEKLYDQADFMELTDTGDVKQVVSGKRGRFIERARAAKKAVKTRVSKVLEKLKPKKQETAVQEMPETAEPVYDYDEDFLPEEEEVEEHDEESPVDKFSREQIEKWYREQEERDAENKRRLEEDAEYAAQFDRGELMRQKMEGVLDDKRAEWGNTVADIERMIEDAESREGYDNFWDRLAEEPELLDELEQAFYGSAGAGHIRPSVFNNLKSKILNRPMTAREARDSQDLYERDQNSAFDIDEGITD